MLTSSSGINCLLNKHEDFDQYGPFAMPYEIMVFHNYPASFVNKMKSLLIYCVNEFIRH